MGGVCSSQTTDDQPTNNSDRFNRIVDVGSHVNSAFHPRHVAPSNVYQNNGLQNINYHGRPVGSVDNPANSIYGTYPGAPNLVNPVYQPNSMAVSNASYHRGFPNISYQGRHSANATNFVNPVYQTMPGVHLYQPEQLVTSNPSFQNNDFQNIVNQRRVDNVGTTNIANPVYQSVPAAINIVNPVYRQAPVVASKIDYQDSGYQATSTQVINTGPTNRVDNSPKCQTEPTVHIGYKNTGIQNIYKIHGSYSGGRTTTAPCNRCETIDPPLEPLGTKVYDPMVGGFVYEQKLVPLSEK